MRTTLPGQPPDAAAVRDRSSQGAASFVALSRDDFERICEAVYTEDEADVLENGWSGGRNGREQDTEILRRIRDKLGISE